jgi:tetratricopeptide (TPR) repeat protein
MNRFENNMILYRPVGLQELALIYDSGMKAFPARLPQQPVFYPVLQLEYARQTASGWNAQNGQFAGYVTQFKVEDQYISQFEKHAVGESQQQEFWIPAEELEEFNRHIVGHINVVEAYFGDAFQGFVPEKSGLQGKNAVAQFTLLANSYLYKRMDFYLELRRNHKAIFLNYLLWQKYEFKNQGLKEKVLQAIKEAWLTSFPKIPLPMPLPVHEDTAYVKQTDSHAQRLEDAVYEDIAAVEQTDPYSLVDTVPEDVETIKQTDSSAQRLVNPVHEDTSPVEQTGSHAQRLINPVHEGTTLPKQTDSHFVQGIQLGLSGKYREAVDELSKAVEEDPDHAVAHTSLGIAFHRLGEDDRALSCYEAALRIDPIYAEAHYFRADILYSHGNVREAIAAYTVAIGLKPELIDAHQ